MLWVKRMSGSGASSSLKDGWVQNCEGKWVLSQAKTKERRKKLVSLTGNGAGGSDEWRRKLRERRQEQGQVAREAAHWRRWRAAPSDLEAAWARERATGQVVAFSPLLFLTWLGFGVPAFVRGCWVCEFAGLNACVVGGARVRCRRSSPGVGVSRRSQVRCLVPAAMQSRARCIDRGRKLARGAPELSGVRAALRLRDVELLDFGSRMGTRGGKCLQNAVLGLCRGSLWEDLRCELRACCDNKFGAGCSRKQDWRNLVSVRSALSVRRLSVVVVSSSSKVAACEGAVDVAWELGCLGGQRLGVLLWCEEEGHVFVMSEAPSLELIVKDFRDAGAPWFRSVVCGKKASSKRGEQLEKARAQRGGRADTSANARASVSVASAPSRITRSQAAAASPR